MLNISSILKQIETGDKTVYRGHADSDWELMPSIGRHYTSDWKDVLKIERESLSELKKKSVPYLIHRPENDIEWLSLMQHHGLSTRLLDFTTNPLIALFFATDPAIKNNGKLITVTYTNTYKKSPNTDVFKHSNSFSYHPPHITERIIGQSGCFVYSHTPNRSLNEKQVTSLEILKSNKMAIREELMQLGISHASLFPGIDGVCNDLNENLISNLTLVDTKQY